MASPVNPVELASISVENELARVAEQLRAVTVQVRSGRGGGSGVVWRRDGLVITNAHVAAGVQPSVVLSDGREFRAELIARSRNADLAALRIPVTGLTAALPRDPRSIRAGELVLAVGNPIGAVGALSAGILHAPADDGCVCADIRLMPGNSGGPLADSAGHVIGINAMVAGGMALAVSSTTVEAFVAACSRN